MKKYLVYILLCLLSCQLYASDCDISITEVEAKHLAKKIWMNETGGDMRKILWWNKGEEFASLGIGHFIWYPRAYEGPYDESFPKYLSFLKTRGVTLPSWIKDEKNPDCPWESREEFFSSRDGKKAKSLEVLLTETWALQAEFILQRLKKSMGLMTSKSSGKNDTIKRQFCRLANTSQGRYALIDYVNFKGEGVNPRERYKGKGWGLKQVLESMDAKKTAHVAFADAAEKVLLKRIDNSPPERKEQRWKAGWLKRVHSYR